MRITASQNYYHDDFECPLYECLRQYCRLHRMLWRDCETVSIGVEGDNDVVNGLHTVFELHDCPMCEREYRIQRAEILAHGKAA